MDKRESLWDLYLRKGMSRRSFLKACVALTTLMGLTTDQVSKVVEAAETKPLPVVVWIHGHECTGCDESFIRSAAPLASDVVLSHIDLEYDHLLSAACGEPFERHLDEVIQKYKGQYILAVEGAACTKDNGVYCMSGGHTFNPSLEEGQRKCCCRNSLWHLRCLRRHPGCQAQSHRFFRHWAFLRLHPGGECAGLPAYPGGHDRRHHACGHVWHHSSP